MELKYDSAPDTLAHIAQVRFFMGRVIDDLERRALVHDASKLLPPEKEAFDRLTPKLHGCTYGSDEYRGYLGQLGEALKHHYAKNSHHPEHGGYDVCVQCGNRADDPCTCGGPRRAGVDRMSLADLVEAICDWLAATKRHDDGDIRKSIELNQKRFGYSDELKRIFLNTLPLLENEPERLSDEQLLEMDGWDMVCESPLEIQDADGSFASGRAARAVIQSLREERSGCGR